MKNKILLPPKKNLALLLPELDSWEQWVLRLLLGMKPGSSLMLVDAEKARSLVKRILSPVIPLPPPANLANLRRLHEKLNKYVELSGSNESTDK